MATTVVVQGIYRDYIGIVEAKMETTIVLYHRVYVGSYSLGWSSAVFRTSTSQVGKISS